MYITPDDLRPLAEFDGKSFRYRFDLNPKCPGYEVPKIKKLGKMTFPVDIINTATGNPENNVCKQCSSCHSCRQTVVYRWLGEF